MSEHYASPTAAATLDMIADGVQLALFRIGIDAQITDGSLYTNNVLKMSIVWGDGVPAYEQCVELRTALMQAFECRNAGVEVDDTNSILLVDSPFTARIAHRSARRAARGLE